MKNKIDTIFFDFFGVFNEDISLKWFYNKYGKDIGEPLRKNVCSKMDIGVIDGIDMFSKIENEIHIPASTIKKEWFDLVNINKELVSKIKELKNNFKIYLLSNSPFFMLDKILKDNNLYDLFDDVFISASINHLKPNKDYFEYVLNKTNTNPNKAIFIDDNMINLVGAKKAKIKGIHYINNELLFKEIDKFTK